MSKEKVFSYEVIDGRIVVAIDVDKDGKNSVELRIDIMEVIQEVVAKVAAKE